MRGLDRKTEPPWEKKREGSVLCETRLTKSREIIAALISQGAAMVEGERGCSEPACCGGEKRGACRESLAGEEEKKFVGGGGGRVFAGGIRTCWEGGGRGVAGGRLPTRYKTLFGGKEVSKSLGPPTREKEGVCRCGGGPPCPSTRKSSPRRTK